MKIFGVPHANVQPYSGSPANTAVYFGLLNSGDTIMGLSLLHISFKYRGNKMPVVAVGVISIGQFGAGIINISQFGIGIVSISQFTIAVYAVAQFAFAYSCIAQIGIYIDQGYGQIVRRLADILGSF